MQSVAKDLLSNCERPSLNSGFPFPLNWEQDYVVFPDNFRSFQATDHANMQGHHKWVRLDLQKLEGWMFFGQVLLLFAFWILKMLQRTVSMHSSVLAGKQESATMYPRILYLDISQILVYET